MTGMTRRHRLRSRPGAGTGDRPSSADQRSTGRSACPSGWRWRPGRRPLGPRGGGRLHVPLQLLRQREGEPLVGRGDLGHVGEAVLGQPVEHLHDQVFRDARAGGHADRGRPGQPFVGDLRRVVDQMGGPGTGVEGQPIRASARICRAARSARRSAGCARRTSSGAARMRS